MKLDCNLTDRIFYVHNFWANFHLYQIPTSVRKQEASFRMFLMLDVH